jgi:hypothetical protein
MVLMDSISGFLTGFSKSPPVEVPELDPDDWAEKAKPLAEWDQEEFNSVFAEESIEGIIQQIPTIMNSDQGLAIKAFDRLKILLNSSEEIPQSQFVDEYIPLSTDSEENIWSLFLQRFNLFVSLTPSIVDELSFDLAINDANVKILVGILNKKNVKKFHINQKADNLYLVEFDTIPILNGSSKENSANPIEGDDDDKDDVELTEEECGLFSTEETKKIFIANSPLFKVNGNLTEFYHNYNALVVALEVELAQVKFQYPKLIGRKIRKVLPYNITTKEELDLLSMTVPLYDANFFFLKFYAITPVKDGTLVKFSLGAHTLQAPRARPKS